MRHDGPSLVGGQSVGRGPCNDGLWLAGSQGVMAYQRTTKGSQSVNLRLDLRLL